MAAIAFYKTRSGFNNFENKDYAAFLHQLNSAYKISSARLFLEKLLEEAYNTIQGKLQVVLDKCTYFKFVMDGFSTKQYDRIIYLSIYTKIRIF